MGLKTLFACTTTLAFCILLLQEAEDDQESGQSVMTWYGQCGERKEGKKKTSSKKIQIEPIRIGYSTSENSARTLTSEQMICLQSTY